MIRRSWVDIDLLISLVVTKKHIIENKKSDATTWQAKEEAWKKIESEYNSVLGACTAMPKI